MHTCQWPIVAYGKHALITPFRWILGMVLWYTGRFAVYC